MSQEIMHWRVKHPTIPTSLDQLQEILLANRQIIDIESFFDPPHPADLAVSAVGINDTEVAKALERLALAKEQQHAILVFGDYDADGVCSTAVLWQTLHYAGFKAQPFIPHREKHGYGLSQRALDEILQGEKPDLIITVDNGIVAHASVERLQAAGIDVIITDHHQLETVNGQDSYPPALANVHTTQLCGTTVAWMFAREISRRWVSGQDRESYLDLCGIATIADQVPLQGANRSFAAWGIKALRNTKCFGIKALCQVAGVDQRSLTTQAINYVLAPRLNALGRLEHNLNALRLLCTTNQQRAQQLVSTLSTVNTKRQDMTYSMVQTAKQEANDWVNQHLIVTASSEFHEGVIGLIAGKLMEEYYKPAIALSVGEHTAKGSARSIPGVNIVELIRQVRDDLLEVGGHPMAAGFSVANDKLERVKQRLLDLAKSQIKPELLQRFVDVECELPFDLLTKKLLLMTEKLAPFGQGNPEPVLAFKKLQVLSAEAMGKEQRHLKLKVGAPMDKKTELTCLVWHQASLLKNLPFGTVVNLAGTIDLNEWKGKTSLQMKVKDLQIV